MLGSLIGLDLVAITSILLDLLFDTMRTLFRRGRITAGRFISARTHFSGDVFRREVYFGGDVFQRGRILAWRLKNRRMNSGLNMQTETDNIKISAVDVAS